MVWSERSPSPSSRCGDFPAGTPPWRVLDATLALTCRECQPGSLLGTMTEPDDLAILAEVDSPLGEELIDAAVGLDPLTARKRLSERFPSVSVEVLRAALEQADLRERARDRFALADDVLWTRAGLEQASRPAVSAYRARALLGFGVHRGVDLTCGLGLDMVAMAVAGLRVSGVESDPLTAALARRNAARAGFPDVPVHIGSCTDESVLKSLPKDAAWFIDPARRDQTRGADGGHRRLNDPEKWSPPWSWVQHLAQRVGTSNGPAVLVAKTSPALNDFAAAAVQWLSVAGDLVEASVWWGVGAAHSRCAVILDSAGATRSVICASGSAMTPTGLPEPGGWLFEPDPAVIRAGAVVDLGQLVGAGLVDDHLAYLSAAAPCDHPAITRQWQVVYAGHYNRQVLANLCADLGISRVDLIGRGRRFDATRVRRELRLPGGPGRVAALHTLALGVQRRSAVVLALPLVHSDV